MKHVLRNKRAGFTLFEMMIVVVIIGLVMAIALPNYFEARTNAVTNTCTSNQKILYTAATMYMIAEDESLEGMSDAEKLNALVVNGYLKGREWRECPASLDGSYDDYEIIFENGLVADVECKIKPSEHEWP